MTEAAVALGILRTDTAECPHPAEALDHAFVTAMWWCTLCGMVVTDEYVARAMLDA